MKLLDFKWLRIAKIWNRPPPPPSSPPHVENNAERIDRIFSKHSQKTAVEETVIMLGDHSRDFDPPESASISEQSEI
jgi:hypothetical protein